MRRVLLKAQMIFSRPCSQKQKLLFLQMLRSQTANCRRDRRMVDSSSRSSPDDLLLWPRVLHGPLHEPLPPQIRKAEMSADGQKRNSNIHQSSINGKQTGKSHLSFTSLVFFDP
jgi:hypothetical protein